MSPAPEGTSGVRAAMVPLVSRRQKLGVLCLWSSDGRLAASEEILSLTLGIASQLATIAGPTISVIVSIVWLVAVINAFNFLDNMDGLSAGVGLIVCIVALASSGILGGTAVAVAGMVGFVGLLVPHVARLLVGHDVRPAFITSILLGAGVMLFADQVARLAFMPSEVPAGMITALLGAPLMIYVARRIRWN